MNEHFSESFLMLFDADPHIVVQLISLHSSFILSMHIKYSSILATHCTLFSTFVMLHWLFLINLSLGSLVQSFKEFFVVEILTLLLIQVHFIFIYFILIVLIFRVASALFLLSCKICQVLIAYFEFSFLLNIDHFGIINSNWTL